MTSSFAATFLSVLSTTWCEYVAFDDPSNADFTLRFGLWEVLTFETRSKLRGDDVEMTRVCEDYPDDFPIDGAQKMARAFSILAPTLGGIVCAYTWFYVCFLGGTLRWKQMGGAFLLCSFFQSLTLLLLLRSSVCRDNDIVEDLGGEDFENAKCQLHWGANSSIVSVCLYLVAGIVMFRTIPPQRRPRPPPETQAVTYSKTTQDDGTEVLVKNVVKGTAVASSPADERGDAVVVPNIQ